MSDHAGDVTNKTGRGYLHHPHNQGDIVKAPPVNEADWFEKRTLIVLTADGGAFRITIEDVGYEGLTPDELAAPDFKPWNP